MRSMHIAKGELWMRDAAGGPARAIESAFAREVVERDAQSRRTTSWKSAPREEASGVIPGQVLWGTRGRSKPLAPPRFMHARRGAGGALYYVLAVGESAGLFRQQLDDGREVRLFHRQDFHCLGFDVDATGERIVLARRHDDRTAHLEVYDADGNLKGAITGGDCVDAAPAFVPGAPATVVFQSSGAARHPQHGHVVAIGHAVVNRIDYANGRLDTLLDDPRCDHLAPRMDAEGRLYAIRRPVEKPPGQKLAATLSDTLLMPWRLAKAIFGYLNFFSMVYGKEPLRSAGGPRTPELDQDIGRLWLHGRLIELAKLDADARNAGGLVPKSWELVCREPSGRIQVLAQHVASFDLGADGTVVCSNGFEVYTLRAGERTTLGRDELVESVGAL